MRRVFDDIGERLQKFAGSRKTAVPSIKITMNVNGRLVAAELEGVMRGKRPYRNILASLMQRPETIGPKV